MGGYQKKQYQVTTVSCYTNLSPLPSPLIRVSGDLIILLFLVQRGRRNYKWEIFLININSSDQKKITSAGFSELLCLVFLKNNQLKIILIEAYFGVANSIPLHHAIQFHTTKYSATHNTLVQKREFHWSGPLLSDEETEAQRE